MVADADASFLQSKLKSPVTDTLFLSKNTGVFVTVLPKQKTPFPVKTLVNETTAATVTFDDGNEIRSGVAEIGTYVLDAKTKFSLLPYGPLIQFDVVPDKAKFVSVPV